MTPEHAIAMLNGQLAKHGEDIELRRITGLASRNVSFAVTCRAFVRGYAEKEMIAGINVADRKVIIGPTEIEASGWPGPETPANSTTDDIRVPREGDVAVIEGRRRNVQEPILPKYLAGVLVRIEFRAVG